jgi:hypothetical protein
MVQIIMLTLPIIGIIGYYTDTEWLYYLCSILTLIATLTMIFSKRLSQTMFEIFIALIIGCWIISSSFIDGLLLGSCAFVIISNLITIYKSMQIFHSFQKKYVDKKPDKEKYQSLSTILNKPSDEKPAKEEKATWVLKDERPFTQEEIDAIDTAIVVSTVQPSRQVDRFTRIVQNIQAVNNERSVQFTMKSGGMTFIPLDNSSNLNAGELIDITKATLITLGKQGEGDIYRVKD